MKLSPLSHTVAQDIKAAIQSCEFASGRPLPSERFLSEKYSVSRTVIRDAVSALAHEGWLHLQERCRPVVANKKGVVTNIRAGHVGVWLWPYTDDFMASAIFRGIRSVLAETDNRLFVSSGGTEPWEETLRREAAFLREVAEDPQAVGAILWYLGGEQNLDAVQECIRRGRQLVFVDRLPPDGIDVDFVGTDNLGASRRVVAQLVQLGHRRIAFVTNLENVSSVRDREAGYRKGLQEASIESRGEFIYKVGTLDGGESQFGALHAVMRLMNCPDRPTAVLAVNDSVAYQLIEALNHLGYRIPEDISIVGFDGLLRWIPGGGSLATVAQDFYRMGEVAADLLLRRTQGVSPNARQHVFLDAPMTLTGSVSEISTKPELLTPSSPNRGLGQ